MRLRGIDYRAEGFQAEGLIGVLPGFRDNASGHDVAVPSLGRLHQLGAQAVVRGDCTGWARIAYSIANAGTSPLTVCAPRVHSVVVDGVRRHDPFRTEEWTNAPPRTLLPGGETRFSLWIPLWDVAPEIHELRVLIPTSAGALVAMTTEPFAHLDDVSDEQRFCTARRGGEVRRRLEFTLEAFPLAELRGLQPGWLIPPDGFAGDSRGREGGNRDDLAVLGIARGAGLGFERDDRGLSRLMAAAMAGEA